MLRTDPQSPTCPHMRTIIHADTSEGTRPPNTTRKSYRLGMSGVANLFVRARRWENKIDSRQTKPGQLVCTSGEPQTHPGIERWVPQDQPRIPVEFAESYVCSGGVNVPPLLAATRAALLDRTRASLGAGTLTDEQWQCVITRPRSQSNGVYKVQIRYMACATHSTARNPGRPVALDQARGIPGLMTILRRCDT